MKSLLQEIQDFEKYKNCLNKELYEVYKNYLVERVLNEITPEGLSRVFKYVFKKDVLKGSDAMMRAIDKLKNGTLQYQYVKKHNQIVKDKSTNLEITDEEFCDKETFIREFEKLDFSKFKSKEDLSTNSTPDTFLKSFLEIYDEDGWLILDDYEDVKKSF